MRKLSLGLWLALSLPSSGAERFFDFKEFPVDKTPPGFRSVVAGKGKAGDWRVIMDEVPPLLAPLTDKAPVVTRRAVLAQLNQDPTDERFPILIFDGESFMDFTLTTRFKLVSGELEQMAGIAFRIQNEKNFYVLRVSALGTNVSFYKVEEGERVDAIRLETQITRGVWHELRIECKGNQIVCLLNNQKALPTITDNKAKPGKIGFWTKSDAISYFVDTRIIYTLREPLLQTIVRDMITQYPRLHGLKIYTLDDKGEPQVVASKSSKEVGTAGGKNEKETITQGNIFYGKDKKSVSVVMPLRDHNGEAIAAVRLNMESFVGQTEQNALSRAMPIVKQMQERVQTREDLTQ